MRGGCNCENITFEMQLPKPPQEYGPRACDCNYCLKHGAAYVSDPNGSLMIHIKDMQWLRRYKQNGTSGIAEFLHCINCGVLAGIIRQEGTQIWGTVNSLAVDNGRFGERVTVSPKQLSDDDKIKRWKQVWFPGVRIFTNVTVTPPL